MGSRLKTCTAKRENGLDNGVTGVPPVSCLPEPEAAAPTTQRVAGLSPGHTLCGEGRS